MEKPDRNSLEYAAYKAQKRAHRDARKLQRETETENPDFRRHHSRSRDDDRRRRNSSRGRGSDDDEGESYSYSETSDNEDEERFSRRGGEPHRKSRSRAQSPSRRRRGSASPSGRERSDSDVVFGGGATYGTNANTSFGYGSSPPGPPPPQGAYTPNVGGGEGGGGGGGGGYGGGRYGDEDSRQNPASPPITAPGSPYPAPGPYGSEQPSSQPLPPPLSPREYAQDYPENPGTSRGGSYYSAPPPATTYASTLPTPQRYPDGAQPPPDGGQYPAALPDGGQYPPPPPGPSLPDKFTPGQGQAALQSMTTTPSVFQYQTDGPNLETTPAPYSGDPKPDPNYPGAPPAGNAYPPSQTLPQYSNRDAPPAGNAYPPTQALPQYSNPDAPPAGNAYPPSQQYSNPDAPPTENAYPPSQALPQYSNRDAPPAGNTYPPSQALPQYSNPDAPPAGNAYPPSQALPQYSNPDAPPAGNAYPSSQALPQYNNPDYYANASRGLEPQRSDSTGTGLAGKLGNLTGLSIPSMSGPGAGGYRPGDRPPPSPALQPYYGTYQSISPLPSPTFPASRSPLLEASGSVSAGKHSASGSFSLGPSAYPSSKKQDKPALYHSSSSMSSYQEVSHTTHHGRRHSGSYSPSSSSSRSPARSRSPSPERRRSYNPMSDAKIILEELKHTFTRPSPRPLINILPTLSPRDLQSLRREYKAQYRGVNLAKHIKSVFTTSSPFGKVVFAVALGPYESEAWFANSWYQRKETRNELLIEALMGKSNSETASIKAAFRDAKYDSSLEKAVSDELPANKFRIAVMAQLSCARMEEDRPLVEEGIREDVARLGSILERGSGGGGETEMVGIIVNRSDRWMREVAALYRQIHGKDLAKAVMRHSKNLVGETLLHILNGLIDKPLRDAKLLDQAITAVTEQNREDLLISRATRIHWDVKHLRRVKSVFKKKYRVDVGRRIKGVEKGSYLEFLLKMMREEEYAG